MKVKLDENLPLQIAVELRARLHDVQTVWEEGLSGHADLDIWEGAQRKDPRSHHTRPGFLGRAKVCARDAPRDRAHTPALAQPTELNRSCPEPFDL